MRLIRRRLVLIVGLGSLMCAGGGSLMAATPALARCSPNHSSGHCYAVAEWNVPNYLLGGVNVEFQTNYAHVEPPNEQMMTNEAWIASFPGRSNSNDWIEAGVKSGVGGSPEGPTYPFWNNGLYFFTADFYGGKWLEQDYPGTGPGNELWDLDMHYVPSTGLWNVITNRGGLGAWGGQPSSAGNAEAGLEETTLNNVNWGTTYAMSWWSAQNGVKYNGWWWNGNGGVGDKLYDEAGRTCGELRNNLEFYWQANAGPC